MPAKHYINEDAQCITTVWRGDATVAGLTTALQTYQLEIKGKAEYMAYNELLDFSDIKSINIQVKDLRRLGSLAVKKDSPEIITRLAIVVSTTFIFGLVRMYQTYRSLMPSSTKELRVFKNKTDAENWLKH
ncbi:MAG: STAS/SEC14 domain-containing protein [Gammaproteobacteria bacterium]|nr:STAS/SEC14 domain-containing protein [Gammaproteobacteria bacterium]